MTTLPRARCLSCPLLVLTIACSGGIWVEHYAEPHTRNTLPASIGLAFVFAASAAVLLTHNRLLLATLALLASFFCTGVVLGLGEFSSISADRVARLYDEGPIAPGDPVELTGVVQGEPEPAPESFYLTLKSVEVRSRGNTRAASGTILLLARTQEPQLRTEYDDLNLRHGAKIRVLTTLDREDNFRNPGVLPFTEYLERKGYDAAGVIKSPMLIERLDDERVFLPLAWLYEWREYLQAEFGRTFNPETAGVLNAALLGNSYNISRATAERFRNGGTFHILVISGLQIAFIAGVVFLIVRRLTRNKLLQFVFTVGLLWGYTLAVGAEASVARAALMFTVAAFAQILARRASTANTIGAAALSLLVWRPVDLFDPSFQLTFLSVLAIVFISVPLLQRMQRVGSWRPAMATPFPPDCPHWFRAISEILFWSERAWRAELAAAHIKYRLFKTPWAKRLEHWRMQKPVRFSAAAIVVSASVQLGMLPVLIIYFHRVSIASLALNILAGVLMAALTFVSLAAVAIAQAGMRLEAPLVMLAEKLNWLMVHLVDPFSRFNVASVRLPHYSGWRSGIYVVYFILLGLLVLCLARWNPLQPQSRRLVRVFQIGFTAFAVALAVVIAHPFSANRPDGKLHVDFLDVGQGDSALLTMPDGTTLLVDGGGRPTFSANAAGVDEAEVPFERDTRSIGEGVVSEFLWSRGLDRVDYVLATHADADHIDGLNDVIRNFKVRSAIAARTPANDPEFSRFAETARQVGVPINFVGAGDVLKIAGVTIDVVWPPPEASPGAASRNNDSIVMHLSFGKTSFLFTGDVEKEGEAQILNEGIVLGSDVVKVAHHGSRTSSTPSFIAATRPSFAIISVGRTSMFGHPHKEVVERWRASGAAVMTTGEKGMISVVTDGEKISLATFLRQ